MNPTPHAAGCDVFNTDSYWMPFTANRDFARAPRVFVSAKHHHYTTIDGRCLYDSFSGLWTTGLGHCHPLVTEAIVQQARTLDCALTFQATNDRALALAARLAELAPGELKSVFFTNSGSEAADTALKIALAYHAAGGAPNRNRFIGRERAYHGVNFGGMSVGGIAANRNAFASNLVPNVLHLPHTLDLEANAFSKGQPAHGADRADTLERFCDRFGDTIAAVIVEPVAGSTGVLPPPVSYLQRVRDICDRRGLLLIFDEVITAFGRVGSWFASERLAVVPDMITLAKGLTNGAVPMGAVLVRRDIFDRVCSVDGPVPEFAHGYTYSGHPLAAAAGLAALAVYEEEGAFEQARALEPHFEELLHQFDHHPKVLDVRNFGLMGAIELAPRDKAPGARGLEIHKTCYWQHDLVVRNGGDTLQFAPFLNAKADDLARQFEKIRQALDASN